MEDEFFEKEVRPILVEKCWQCHGDGKTIKGGLRLTSRSSLLKGGDNGPAVVVGDPKTSPLIEAIRYEHETRMPPKGKLKEREIDVLSRWVTKGLPWPADKLEPSTANSVNPVGKIKDDERRGFWSFQAIKAVPLPEPREIAWLRSPIDRFILAQLEEKGLRHAAPADRRTLLRRASFDLIGLPPTPEEITAFLTDDSPLAFARVVDRLLASPRYGERWGRHWLDVVRYADARDLIQLPAESDFREIWRYRDWVVDSFNRDLPYSDFLRHQIAGDLLPLSRQSTLNKDGIVATGLLALADFVPGDVDKEQMIADYVNDQIDVVSRAFLGLSIACARCHDHKFDPISTEDYYALAGIFFSTRLVPGPVPGNTPLVRVPLLAADEIAKVKLSEAKNKQRRMDLELQLPDAADRAYLALLQRLLKSDETVRYLVAASQFRTAPGKISLTALAKQHGLEEGLLKGFVDYLGKVAEQPSIPRHPSLRELASGKVSGPTLETAAARLRKDLSEVAARREASRDHSHKAIALASANLIHLQANDPSLITDRDGRVTFWPNRAGLPANATSALTAHGPVKATTMINGQSRTVLRFDGDTLLEVPRRAPFNGSLFVVLRVGEKAGSGQRVLGWEDSDSGKHGFGLISDPGGRLHAILRNDGKSGDLVHQQATPGFEIVCITWGPNGTTLSRNGVAVGSQKGVDAVSCDPKIEALHLGGPGSGGGPRFRGDLGEIRVYDRQLDDAERTLVEAELRASWFDPVDPKASANDPLAELCEEWLSSRGPFWLSAEARLKKLPPDERTRLEAMGRELEVLRKTPPQEVPQAVAVQDGGPKGTSHEGFKDSPVFIRGNSKRPGKIVPRGVPRILLGKQNSPISIKEGSGRRQLADWMARPENPLTARVMVNRIWQHHFGEGIVRTSNDFGERGERPTHPDLLDYLASSFVDSGWSVKSMHRTIMLSSTYQQSSQADSKALAFDPDNRLIGRGNRRRLDAEAIRDALLKTAGRLDQTPGGIAFADLSIPRRTVYLQSVRTGPSVSDFGRLFDRADPGSMVARRGESVVAPQSLFFLNDPFVSEQSRALAVLVAREEGTAQVPRIQKAYTLVLGRPPSVAELDFAIRFLASGQDGQTWERFCHLLVCQNEFIFID